MRSLLYLTGRTPSPFPAEPEHLSALRFFFIKTLKRNWGVEETPSQAPDSLARRPEPVAYSITSQTRRSGLSADSINRWTSSRQCRMLIHVHSQSNARDRWLKARRSELLAAPYTHVTFSHSYTNWGRWPCKTKR
jgi:hypothetical protein